MLSSDIINIISSFLPNKEQHNIALCNKNVYSYNEYIKINPKNNDLFMRDIVNIVNIVMMKC
jgi:hypothetical protein